MFIDIHICTCLYTISCFPKYFFFFLFLFIFFPHFYLLANASASFLPLYLSFVIQVYYIYVYIYIYINLKSNLGKIGSKLQSIHQKRENPSSETLGEKLLSLDQKVSDIDNKLIDLKHQLDNNFLQNDDINAEASEKKPVSMSVIEITKAMSNEIINHITIEIENLRQATNNMDRKLQFHVNLVSDRLGTIYNMMTDVHDAILVRGTTNTRSPFNITTTTTTEPPPKQSKIDRLVEQMYPMLTVSEKMDEVWNIVVS